MRHLLLPLLFFVSLGLPAGDLKDGVLDLTSWDGHSSVSATGDWEFWPRAFPDPGPGTPLAVPGAWNGPLGGSDGWGTYRLKIRLGDPAPGDLALSVPLINSSSVILWDGKPVWTSGRWAETPENYIPERRTGVAALVPSPGLHNLEIRVASWGDINAGLNEPFRLGTLTGLLNERSSDVAASVFLFGCLFIMGIYHLGLFGFRPVDRSPLWFGLLSVLLGLRGLVNGACYLDDLIPGLGWEGLMKVGYLTFSASTLFFGMFIQDLFPKVCPRWFQPVLGAGAGTYALANLFLPVAWYSPVLPYFQLYVGLIGLYVCYLLVKAVLSDQRGARLFLVGFILFFATVVNDILKTNYFIPTPYLSPLGLLAFLVFQSLVMIEKFTAAFSDSEKFARHLVRLNTSLERFIPREVLGFLQKDSIVEIELGDHCQQPMSVLFADIRDFTTLSESMTPEENFKFINSYLRRMGPVVRRNNGFVDKYLGDGIMALFPGDSSQAFDAALDLRAALEEYNIHRAKSGYPEIRMGIGIHRGPLMLGTIGENQRMDSTVISDTVNAASRLEGLTKKFGRAILVSGETIDALKPEESSFYGLEYLDEETVKGRTKALKVFALTKLEGSPAL